MHVNGLQSRSIAASIAVTVTVTLIADSKCRVRAARGARLSAPEIVGTCTTSNERDSKSE